jgi:protein-L-isoaspartate(D-aspartate) O-methyltransferase
MAKKVINPDLIELLDELREKDAIKSQEVYDIMSKVDRRNFVPHGAEPLAYIDCPIRLGWGINLSAPHMYAYALEMLKETVK